MIRSRRQVAHSRIPGEVGQTARRTGLFVGDAAITIRCVESWIQRGHRCLGLVTADACCLEWAAWHGIATCDAAPPTPLTLADLLQLTDGETPDVLWSVHNIRVLSAEVLALASEAAINYHDALLPAYAGLHAPSWALLARETHHGITWHYMVGTLDAGNILEQEAVAVAANDTAWSLGLRCVEAAERAYLRILDRMESGELCGQPQPAHGRAYFAASQKPTPGCIINWQRSAEEIDAFVRALDFGPADNPLGLPKVLTAHGALAVRRLSMTDRPSSQAPGTIVACPHDASPEGWIIATATHDIELHGWTRLDGAPVNATDLATLGIRVGEIFLSAVPGDEVITAWERRARRFEAVWRRRLEDVRSLAPSDFETPVQSGGEVVIRRLRLDATPAAGPEAGLLSVLCALAQEVGEPFDVAFAEGRAAEPVSVCSALTETAPPLRVVPEIAAMHRQLDLHRSLPACPADLVGRSRRLREHAVERNCLVEVRAGGKRTEDGTRAPASRVSRKLIVDVYDGGADFTAAVEHAKPLDALAERLRARLDAAPLAGPSEAPPPNVIESFFTLAGLKPEAVAIVEDGTDRSYGELARRAAALADALRGRKIGPGDVVAVRVTRLFDLVTALLGIGAAGGAFWALDENETESRILRLFREASPRALITDNPAWFPGARTHLPHGIIPIAVADVRRTRVNMTQEPAKADALAYLAFTSGSTGFPKGVAITHASLAHYIAWFGHHCALGPGDRLLQTGSPAFDLAYEQIFATLTLGAALIASPRPLGSAREIWHHIAQQGVTMLDLPTGLWHQLAPVLEACPERWPSRVRLLCLGGEAARSSTIAVLRRVAAPGFRCLNSYGPTEATIVAAVLEVPLDFPCEKQAVLPLGVPVAGAITEICCENGERVGNGEIGELWLSAGQDLLPPAVPLGVAGSDPVQVRLDACWNLALGFPPATPNDDFFEQGGDSMAAITLLAEIESEFGVALPVTDLLQYPTPRGLAGRLIAADEQRGTAGTRGPATRVRSSAIVAMRKGVGVPLVLVHCLGGHVLRMRTLSQSLPEGVICWGLQVPGLDDAEVTPQTVEELAEHYLAELGPRLDGQRLDVCGVSFGGVVALEMARRHAGRGGLVGLVGLFDTELKHLLPSCRARTAERLRRKHGRFNRISRIIRNHLRATFPGVNRMARSLRERAAPEKKPDQQTQPTQLDPYPHHAHIQEILKTALDRYQLGVTPVPITFFAATPRPPAYYDELRSLLRSDVEVVHVPGEHLSIFEPPYVETLVREILARRAHGVGADGMLRVAGPLA